MQPETLDDPYRARIDSQPAAVRLRDYSPPRNRAVGVTWLFLAVVLVAATGWLLLNVSAMTYP